MRTCNASCILFSSSTRQTSSPNLNAGAVYEDLARTVMSFRLPAGRRHDVRASELAPGRQRFEVVCNVALLDGSVQTFKVNKQDAGQVLLDVVFQHLELTERDYFGLQLADVCSDSQRWLDPTKPLKKQLKRGSPHSLNFRVKFFVSDPNKLQEEYTRYQYFLQIKQDILSGRLSCPNTTAAILASYAVQSELGDYSDSEHLPGYLSEYRSIPNTPQDFEKEIVKHHQLHTGLSPAQSEFNYLNTARTLDLYGVELHHARDQNDAEISVGVMSTGVGIYDSRVRINCFPWVKIVKISFKSRRFFIQLRKELHESREAFVGFNMVSYRACKTLWKACVEHHTFFRLDRPVPPRKTLLTHYFTLGSKFRYSGRTEVQSVQYGKEKAVKARVFTRSPSKPLMRRLMDGLDWDSVSRTSAAEERLETQSLPTRSPPGTPCHNNSVRVQDDGRLRPSSVGHLLDHLDQSAGSPCRALSHHRSSDNSPNGEVPHDSLVLIKMSPDENGRFGFNVKGGLDQKMPVIVSRVAPGTAADLCVPRLNEGDQVVQINGRDISDRSHDDVVVIIKAYCDQRCGELALLVRPNAIYDVVEENLDSDLQYQYPSERSLQASDHQDHDPTRTSMLQLKEGLRSGAILTQFEQLYRKKPGMSMTCARLPKNVSKNRYRDISPYDATRVILRGEKDYINANYINMEIPGSNMVNRYIACQGPLPSTCADFWQMTWEQSSSLVVMLTTQVERGRVKCHQYWPCLAGSTSYGAFQVACVTEEGGPAFVVRELTLTHLESKKRHSLTQVQYVSWPDHGVPEDSTDFLKLVSLVRSKRRGKEEEPVVVHCSAGIGRTGVLITMETAMCLLEAGEPVYPLDIVRAMRDQRSMMIQTLSQYKFVCEAILKVYEEELVQPPTLTSSPQESTDSNPCQSSQKLNKRLRQVP
ncbi:tyrosine-protein phosphatase non-receptor type 4-like [Aplochiton taeniatus]